MKKLIFYLTVALLFLMGCQTEELSDYKADKETTVEQSETVRTLSLSAIMPEESKEHSTRVALTQEENKVISLTWEENDQLELCFLQGDAKVKKIVTVKNISADRKKASFDVVLPEDITDGLFDLYGVYGGGGLSDSDPTLAIFPTLSESTSSLNDLANGHYTMLHFSAKEINTANVQLSVTFHHLGSLFCLTLKNTTAISLDNMGKAHLSSSTSGWAYNSALSGKGYNLASEQFQDVETAGDYISLYADGGIETNDTLNFWGWYPPLPNVNWSELTLELYDKNGLLIDISSNVKPAKTAPTAAGKCFYFYGVLNDAGLYFTDNTYTPPLNLEDLTIEGDLRHADSGNNFIGMVYTRAGNVYYNQAQTNGVWSGEINLGAGTDPRIAIDSNNKPHVVYVADSKIVYRINDGTGFTATDFIETNYGGKCSKPDIAVDENGFAHITYTDSKGNTGAYSDRDDIMYAVNSSGSFVKTLIYDGYYEAWGGASYTGNYYQQGSRITVDGTGQYFILSHLYYYDKWMNGNYKTYTVRVKSGSVEGSIIGADIYDIAFDGTNVIALYKVGSVVISAKLTVSDTAISFDNPQTVATALTNNSANPATLLAMPGMRALGGISGGKVFMKYDSEEEIIDESVKSSTNVLVVQCAGDVFVAYSGTDSIIRLMKRE